MPREADVPYFNYRSGGSEAWRHSAACAPVGTKYPWTAIGPGSRPALRVGKAICEEICPVRAECLTYALTAGIDHGTWGGLTEQERASMGARERRLAINIGRMTRYDVRTPRTMEEYLMVVVIAKTKFVPHLAPGEIGEVEDPLARVAVRNGYATLVGKIENFDDWMYHGAELIVAGRTAVANAAAKETPAATPKPRRAKKPQTDMVEASIGMVEETA